MSDEKNPGSAGGVVDAVRPADADPKVADPKTADPKIKAKTTRPAPVTDVKESGGSPEPVTASVAMASGTPASNRPVKALRGGSVRHLADLIDLVADDDELPDDDRHHHRPIVYQPFLIIIDSLRANSKVFIAIREDQRAVWSEGNGRGLVGFSISSTRDPTIYMRTFLINSRELYLESYRDCLEIQIQLYVQTPQSDLRGRIELPPGASVTLQTGIDRTSLIGLSSFCVEFPTGG